MEKVLIIGGGSAGVTVAARLQRARRELDVTIIDPASVHYYQPLWTLAGAGVGSKESTAKRMEKLVPAGARWIKEAVSAFRPEKNEVILASGAELSYDALVVCPGIQLDWNKIEGLPAAMGKNGVCSNYSFETVDSTWKALKDTTEGRALFTFPNTPVKCGGAPQKIMYLAEDFFRRRGLRDKVNIEFVSAGQRIFGISKYKKTLENIVASRGIETSFNLNLVKIDAESKRAWFRDLSTGEEKVKEFSMIHVVPPMSAPDFVKNSSLADDKGWVDVDKNTLQHVRYPNVFSLGDASNLPTAKTGAAVRKQAPVLVANLLSVLEGRQPERAYNGYTSCPIVTGYGKLILAEFDYDGNPVESFPFDQSKERRSMWFLKKYILPLIYWKGMLKGRL